jgi:5,10-methylenetetrahydromethanopterin reductase
VAPGFLSVRSIDRRRAGLATMREAILALRRLLAGESASFESADEGLRLRNVSEVPTPVYLLAAGPRMVELAGEVADGALLMVGLQPAAIETARRHLEAGAQRANRSLEHFKTIFVVPIALDDQLQAAQSWIRRWFAPGQPWLNYPSTSNLYWLRAAGILVSEDQPPEEIPADQVDRIADAFGLFGPPERCAERLLEAQQVSGVEHVFLFPAHTLESGYDLPIREVEAFGRVIRPCLNTRTSQP